MKCTIKVAKLKSIFILIFFWISSINSSNENHPFEIAIKQGSLNNVIAAAKKYPELLNYSNGLYSLPILAIVNKQPQIAKYLLSLCETDINLQTLCGTPLLCVLLEIHAFYNKNKYNNFGWDGFNDLLEIAQLLLLNGADYETPIWIIKESIWDRMKSNAEEYIIYLPFEILKQEQIRRKSKKQVPIHRHAMEAGSILRSHGIPAQVAAIVQNYISPGDWDPFILKKYWLEQKSKIKSLK